MSENLKHKIVHKSKLCPSSWQSSMKYAMTQEKIKYQLNKILTIFQNISMKYSAAKISPSISVLSSSFDEDKIYRTYRDIWSTWGSQRSSACSQKLLECFYLESVLSASKMCYKSCRQSCGTLRWHIRNLRSTDDAQIRKYKGSVLWHFTFPSQLHYGAFCKDPQILSSESHNFLQPSGSITSESKLFPLTSASDISTALLAIFPHLLFLINYLRITEFGGIPSSFWVHV